MKRLSPHRVEFVRLAADPAGINESSLARAALLLGCEVRPDMDVVAYVARLKDLATRFVTRQGERGSSLRDRIEALNDVLFADYGLRGNTEHYHDPRNSFLDQVLDRRTGVPITLSMVFLAVGRQGGLDVQGVGLPGHFIVQVADGEERVLVDPFHSGRILTEDDCRSRVHTAYGESRQWHDDYLRVTSPREILVRVLGNLKRIYLHETDFLQVLWVQDLLVLLRPDDATQYRDRGLVHAQLQRYADARRDLREYLERWPGRAPDAEEIERDLKRLRRLHHMLN